VSSPLLREICYLPYVRTKPHSEANKPLTCFLVSTHPATCISKHSSKATYSEYVSHFHSFLLPIEKCLVFQAFSRMQLPECLEPTWLKPRWLKEKKNGPQRLKINGPQRLHKMTKIL
jgi:hypothetical protein